MHSTATSRVIWPRQIHYVLVILLGLCVLAGYIILFRHALPADDIISTNTHFPRSHIVITHRTPSIAQSNVTNTSSTTPQPLPINTTTNTTEKEPPKFIPIPVETPKVNAPTTAPIIPIHESWSLMAKFHRENVLHQHHYAKNSWSFHFRDGDGSALFINNSRYKDSFQFKSFQFCPVPKVGVSSWKQVIKRIKGSPVYLADDHWSLHDPIENEVESDRIHKLGVDGANQLLFSGEDIFYAIFVRDPVSRALSAFLDKCIGSRWVSKHWCQPTTAFNTAIRKRNGVYSQFDLFIESVINKV